MTDEVRKLFMTSWIHVISARRLYGQNPHHLCHRVWILILNSRNMKNIKLGGSIVEKFPNHLAYSREGRGSWMSNLPHKTTL